MQKLTNSYYKDGVREKVFRYVGSSLLELTLIHICLYFFCKPKTFYKTDYMTNDS